jgi:hypothetical protein
MVVARVAENAPEDGRREGANLVVADKGGGGGGHDRLLGGRGE